MKYSTVRYRDINVSYTPALDGGGTGFGQEFVSVVKEKFGRVARVFEFCAGPGFIGFSLLAEGLCDKLTLADVNPEACNACVATVVTNDLRSRVSVFRSDCLDTIPETEQWDLIVSNPPHWPSDEATYHTDIRKFDPDLSIHKRFYRDVGKFLAPGGTILFQENGRATRAEDLTPIIEGDGYRVVDVFKARPPSVLSCLLRGRHPKWAKPSAYYFMQSVRKSDPV